MTSPHSALDDMVGGSHARNTPGGMATRCMVIEEFKLVVITGDRQNSIKNTNKNKRVF